MFFATTASLDGADALFLHANSAIPLENLGERPIWGPVW
jgi:hypothetical protein